MGWNFYREEMYDSAEYYYKNSLRYSLPGKQFMTSANSYGNLGTIARDLKKYNDALGYYRQAIEYAEKAVVSKHVLKKETGNISLFAFLMR